MRGIWHLSLAVLLLAGVAAPVHADLVSGTFGGIWVKCGGCPGPLGVIHAGDPFSGAATWDTETSALQSFSFVMPVVEGLSFASIPNPQVLSARVGVGRISDLQWTEESTADHNIYAFDIAIPAQFKGASVHSPSLDPFNDFLTFTGDYGTTGPTPVPEPSTISLLAGGLALIGLIGMVRKRLFEKAGGVRTILGLQCLEVVVSHRWGGKISRRNTGSRSRSRRTPV